MNMDALIFLFVIIFACVYVQRWTWGIFSTNEVNCQGGICKISHNGQTIATIKGNGMMQVDIVDHKLRIRGEGLSLDNTDSNNLKGLKIYEDGSKIEFTLPPATGQNIQISNSQVSKNDENIEPSYFEFSTYNGLWAFNEVIHKIWGQISKLVPIISNHGKINENGVAIVGHHNTITGNGNTITGHHNQIYGNSNNVIGHHNTIHGDENSIVGDHNKAYGKGNKATGHHNHDNQNSFFDFFNFF